MTERTSEAHLSQLEHLLRLSLDQVSNLLTEQEIIDIQEYIQHGEYGVGWELLWFIIKERELPEPSELKQCGVEMGFDVS
jgi:hypothetical protein